MLGNAYVKNEPESASYNAEPMGEEVKEQIFIGDSYKITEHDGGTDIRWSLSESLKPKDAARSVLASLPQKLVSPKDKSDEPKTYSK